jgi:hypothetical protein
MSFLHLTCALLSILLLASTTWLVRSQAELQELRAELRSCTTTHVTDPAMRTFERHHDDFANGNPWYWHCAGTDSAFRTMYIVKDRNGMRVFTDYDLTRLGELRQGSSPSLIPDLAVALPSSRY